MTPLRFLLAALRVAVVAAIVVGICYAAVPVMQLGALVHALSGSAK